MRPRGIKTKPHPSFSGPMGFELGLSRIFETICERPMREARLLVWFLRKESTNRAIAGKSSSRLFPAHSCQTASWVAFDRSQYSLERCRLRLFSGQHKGNKLRKLPLDIVIASRKSLVCSHLPGNGFEPIPLSRPDPKSGASANFATPAQKQCQQCHQCDDCQQFSLA